MTGIFTDANSLTVDTPSILGLDTCTLTLSLTGNSLIISGTLPGTGTVLCWGGTVQT